jgi:hypothetical protein
MRPKWALQWQTAMAKPSQRGMKKSIGCRIIKKLPQFDISLVTSKKGVVVTSHRNPI